MGGEESEEWGASEDLWWGEGQDPWGPGPGMGQAPQCEPEEAAGVVPACAQPCGRQVSPEGAEGTADTRCPGQGSP